MHPPQVFAVVTPQIWPTVVQSLSTLQLPATHLPALSHTYDVVPPP